MVTKPLTAMEPLSQKVLYIYIYIYAFSRRFYPKRLTIAFRLYILLVHVFTVEKVYKKKKVILRTEEIFIITKLYMP